MKKQLRAEIDVLCRILSGLWSLLLGYCLLFYVSGGLIFIQDTVYFLLWLVSVALFLILLYFDNPHHDHDYEHNL